MHEANPAVVLCMAAALIACLVGAGAGLAAWISRRWWHV